MAEETKGTKLSTGNVFRLTCCSIAIILILSSAVFSQIPIVMESANTRLKNSQATSNAERSAILKEIADDLSRAASVDPEIDEYVRLLKLQAEWLLIDYSALYEPTNRAVAAPDSAERNKELEKVRLELLQRTAFVMSALDPRKLTPEDAQRISNVMQTASKAFDEASAPALLESKASTFTKLVSLGNGFVKLKNSIEDPKAAEILDGLNATVGSLQTKLTRLVISVKGPFEAFAWPAAVLGATQEQTMKAWQQGTAALEEIPNIMDGDPEALKNFQGHANEVARSLSPFNFGRAMLGALASQAISKVPFFGTIRNWIYSETPYIDRRLGLTVNCAGTFTTDPQPIIITQKLNRIIAVTDSGTSCYQKGEVLFEGVHEEGNVYSVVIYRIWDQNETKGLLRGKVVVQMRNFVRMEAAGMYSNSSDTSKYLVP